MRNTETRIAALEAKATPADGITIVRRFVSPGELDAEIDHICDEHGNEWIRQPGETEAAFTDRAALATKPTPWGVKSLIACNRVIHHAKH